MIARDHGSFSQAAITEALRVRAENERLTAALAAIAALPNMPWNTRAKRFVEAKHIARTALNRR